MKKELIKTDNYLLVVDDSEIKEGDWMYRNNEEPILVTPNFWWDFQVKYCKVIAHLPLNNSPILEGVDLLPPLEQEDDVEKIADNSWEGCDGCDKNDELFYKNGYIKGYNRARKKYKFTEEDAKYIFECGRNFQLTGEGTFTEVYNETFGGNNE